MAQAASPNGAPPPMLLSVAEAREARERARTGAAEKGQEAHRWLGERYRRLLESADAIGDLGVAARDATAFAAAASGDVILAGGGGRAGVACEAAVASRAFASTAVAKAVASLAATPRSPIASADSNSRR